MTGITLVPALYVSQNSNFLFVSHATTTENLCTNSRIFTTFAKFLSSCSTTTNKWTARHSPTIITSTYVFGDATVSSYILRTQRHCTNNILGPQIILKSITPRATRSLHTVKQLIRRQFYIVYPTCTYIEIFVISRAARSSQRMTNGTVNSPNLWQWNNNSPKKNK